jgi:prepilin-type N-terminal cleavage/methylation domain-containing protein
MKVVNQNKGFTLFEVIVTSIILVIISGLAIGSFSAYFSTGRQRMLENAGNQIDLARAYAQTQAYPTYIEFTKDEDKGQNIATIYIKKGSDASATKEILSEEAIGNSQYTLWYIPSGNTSFTAPNDTAGK